MLCKNRLVVSYRAVPITHKKYKVGRAHDACAVAGVVGAHPAASTERSAKEKYITIAYRRHALVTCMCYVTAGIATYVVLQVLMQHAGLSDTVAIHAS